VIAPGFDAEALDILSASKNVRLLRCPGGFGGAGSPPVSGGVWGGHPRGVEYRQVSGGMPQPSRGPVGGPGDDPAILQVQAARPVRSGVLADLTFGWKACRSVKSNAILLASSGASVGVGMGQVNRVDSARLAVARAGDRAAGSVAASDAYFPFPDG